jgi:LysR family transcriptional regulator, mexEF-oprN operon transcriptional activator
MTAIDINHLRRLDLNLLPVFMALMRERNLTRAADHLNLGQPAVSAALKRLREAVGDQLFVRGRDGMMPTDRALALVQSLEPALGAIHSALRDKPSFAPQQEERIFRLGMSDNHEHFLLPPLMARLRTEAPQARVVVRPVGWSQGGAALDSGEVELLCGYLPELASWHSREPLFESGFQCMFDRKRVGFSGALTLPRYLALPHLMVSSRGEFEGAVDDALARLGKSRRVVMVTAHFSVLPAVLKRIPAVATLPEHTARHLAREARLEVCDPPVALRGYQSSLAWLRTRDDDPAHRWLRETVVSTAQGIAASS